LGSKPLGTFFDLGRLLNERTLASLLPRGGPVQEAYADLGAVVMPRREDKALLLSLRGMEAVWFEVS